MRSERRDTVGLLTRSVIRVLVPLAEAAAVAAVPGRSGGRDHRAVRTGLRRRRRRRWRRGRRRRSRRAGAEGLANRQSNRPRLTDQIAEPRPEAALAIDRQLRILVEQVLDVDRDVEAIGPMEACRQVGDRISRKRSELIVVRMPLPAVPVARLQNKALETRPAPGSWSPGSRSGCRYVGRCR